LAGMLFGAPGGIELDAVGRFGYGLIGL